jgi:hypothetical protein
MLNLNPEPKSQTMQQSFCKLSNPEPQTLNPKP